MPVRLGPCGANGHLARCLEISDCALSNRIDHQLPVRLALAQIFEDTTARACFQLLPHEELQTCTPMFLMIWEMQRLHPKHKAISFLVKGKIMEIRKFI